MNLCTAIIILSRTKRFGRFKVAKVSSYHADAICKPQGRSFCVRDHVTYYGHFWYVTSIFTSVLQERIRDVCFFLSVGFISLLVDFPSVIKRNVAVADL